MPRPELGLEAAAADLFGKCELRDAVRELSKYQSGRADLNLNVA